MRLVRKAEECRQGRELMRVAFEVYTRRPNDNYNCCSVRATRHPSSRPPTTPHPLSALDRLVSVALIFPTEREAPNPLSSIKNYCFAPPTPLPSERTPAAPSLGPLAAFCYRLPASRHPNKQNERESFVTRVIGFGNRAEAFENTMVGILCEGELHRPAQGRRSNSNGTLFSSNTGPRILATMLRYHPPKQQQSGTFNCPNTDKQ